VGLIAEQIEHLRPKGVVDSSRTLSGFFAFRCEFDGPVRKHRGSRSGARQSQNRDCAPMTDPLLRRAQAANVFKRIAAVVEHVGKRALISA
jgi:hypothetical protein